MKDWILSGGVGVLALLLPFLLPNTKVYRWTRATVGKLIKAMTIKTADNPLKPLFGWILNTIAAFCSAISDEVRGIPPMEESNGLHVVERLNGNASGEKSKAK